MRSCAHASGLNRFRAIRSTRVVIPLHIEEIERIQIKPEIHALSDWEDLEDRKVRGPIDRPRNNGL